MLTLLLSKMIRIKLILSLPILFCILVNCQNNGLLTKAYRNLYGSKPFAPTFQTLLDSVQGVFQLSKDSDEFKRKEPLDQSPNNGAKYDFIIVGAGTAGATLAGRLSEEKTVSVLLLEAGPEENIIMDIPLAIPLTQWNSDVNWRYRTEPSDRYCLGMKNHSCYWPRGKVMGGSSTLNYMIATRGHPKDYDRWAEMGNPGWSYQDVLPYFKKLEDVNYLQNKDEGMHGFGGPVPIRHPAFFTPVSEAFVQAGVELGYEVVDYNGFKQTGFAHLQTNIKNGYRVSSNKAYLHPARNRRNLVISKNSMVIKILFNSDNTRAVGVTYKKNKRIYRVFAEKEVIISAGSINSPQLLMLSGIGPASHLGEFNIKPIADLPVGENLMDHIAYGTLIFKLDQPVALNLNEISDLSNPYVRDYLLKKSGPLTIPNGCESIAFIDVDNFTGREEYPNLEFLFLSGTLFTNSLFPHIWGIADDVWTKMAAKLDDNGHYMTIFPMILRPKSRGRILLKSSSPYRQPRIIPNYLSDKDDVRVLVSGIKRALEVTQTKAMQQFGAKLVHVPLKGCEHLDHYSDEYWECALRTITFNIYHYSGTCKMGPRNDSSTVVNSRLQVHGIERLRVADASIMPEIPSGHTNIPTFMIAEKLADMIKADWDLSIYRNIVNV